MSESKNKMLTPKDDVIFQGLFGEPGNERITKKFLESILKEKIESIDLNQNQLLRRRHENDKLGVLDVIATINGGVKCHVEMQVSKETTIIERLLYYWSRVYSKQLVEGEKYDKLEKTIGILIADFEIKGLEELQYVTKWKIIETENRKVILTNKLELVILELPKINWEDEENSELLDWLSFLVNPESERVKKKMEESDEFEEAVRKYIELSQNEEVQRIADLRLKAVWDENQRIADRIAEVEKAKNEEIAEAREKARTEGLSEGLAEGRAEGRAEGKAEGEATGRAEAKLEDAKKMLEKRNRYRYNSRNYRIRKK